MDGCSSAFFAAHEEANEETVTDFLAFSTSNPSSIRNCFEVARHNARSVRTALTMEMWDAINGAWLELKRFGYEVSVISPDYFCPFPDGTSLTLWGDLDRDRSNIARFSKRDADAYIEFDRYFERVAAMIGQRDDDGKKGFVGHRLGT